MSGLRVSRTGRTTWASSTGPSGWPTRTSTPRWGRTAWPNDTSIERGLKYNLNRAFIIQVQKEDIRHDFIVCDFNLMRSWQLYSRVAIGCIQQPNALHKHVYRLAQLDLTTETEFSLHFQFTWNITPETNFMPQIQLSQPVKQIKIVLIFPHSQQGDSDY